MAVLSLFPSPGLSPFEGYSREALHDAGTSQYSGVYAEEANTWDVLDKARNSLAIPGDAAYTAVSKNPEIKHNVHIVRLNKRWEPKF